MIYPIYPGTEVNILNWETRNLKAHQFKLSLRFAKNFSYLIQKGSMRINQTQLNDLALSYPLRVSVDVKWTEALTSR